MQIHRVFPGEYADSPVFGKGESAYSAVFGVELSRELPGRMSDAVYGWFYSSYWFAGGLGEGGADFVDGRQGGVEVVRFLPQLAPL
jgi:hypothetical protein